ncbi:hypothetical protein OLMES_5066 [Oleiphilus messinensis]|uniref:Uncharacterized protein n=1 Tax=Oleiphilus messinensis TaxID=141451 RepID=A0A1Y0IFN6_9GAMM|nr:hypothetical protein [Oleiphilus messinensis]ARU59050.1 hypothetical protein OLMES_5066 [Oleiphilus messinensis]
MAELLSIGAAAFLLGVSGKRYPAFRAPCAVGIGSFKPFDDGVRRTKSNSGRRGNLRLAEPKARLTVSNDASKNKR